MKLSEKLVLLRRKQGLSQEALAEKLNAARQTISKWENGQTVPELDMLVRLTDLYGISLDWLVRGEGGCQTSVETDTAATGEEFIGFLLRAKRSTYAAKGRETKPSRTASHDYAYAEGQYAYLDTYVGGERFAGEEAVWFDSRPMWAMNYAGRVLGNGFSGDFLKEALLRGTPETPYRGPALCIKGEYVYHCHVEGTIDWFYGEEEIYLSGNRIYECRFSGGIIR
ncbi:MAG: helix-turn-helix transcriptional regulator [Clostridia bacterium]|nr:helix-turn-helix transcriptional regulator [Clostridia bacterium]